MTLENALVDLKLLENCWNELELVKATISQSKNTKIKLTRKSREIQYLPSKPVDFNTSVCCLLNCRKIHKNLEFYMFVL